MYRILKVGWRNNEKTNLGNHWVARADFVWPPDYKGSRRRLAEILCFMVSSFFFLWKSRTSSERGLWPVPGLGVSHLGELSICYLPQRRLWMLHRTKLLELFLPHPRDQQRSPCSLNFLAVTASYHSKVISIGALLAEKIAKIVFFSPCISYYISSIPFLTVRKQTGMLNTAFEPPNH